MKTKVFSFVDPDSRLSGLGLATTEKLVNLGAHVAIVDLEDSTGISQRLGSQVRFFKVDVSNTRQIGSAVTGIVGWAKEISEDIAAIVCCAGILGPAKVGQEPANL
jgi:3-hydroxyacyl-CoA dehydrogenase / 3-hydroxy-2-methylbutyryl-CoA dehydrogenase